MPPVEKCHQFSARGNILICNVSAAAVLIISPVLLGTLTVVTMIWAFSYGHRVRLRALDQLNQITSPDVH
jgi:hypothetical protein